MRTDLNAPILNGAQTSDFGALTSSLNGSFEQSGDSPCIRGKCGNKILFIIYETYYFRSKSQLMTDHKKVQEGMRGTDDFC